MQHQQQPYCSDTSHVLTIKFLLHLLSRRIFPVWFLAAQLLPSCNGVVLRYSIGQDGDCLVGSA